MPPKLEFARAWLAKAARDLETGQRALHPPPLPDTASFHAQQAVEKALKALLIVREIDPPRTHLLSVLLDRLAPRDDRLAGIRDRLEWLTAFAVDARYPDVDGEPTVDQAREALAIARDAFDLILEIVPAEARP